jgi:hypothetical protein
LWLQAALLVIDYLERLLDHLYYIHLKYNRSVNGYGVVVVGVVWAIWRAVF